MSVAISKHGCTHLVLWNLIQKSSVISTELNCWYGNCQPSKASLMKFTSCSRTMHWLIMHVKWWSCFIVKLWNSLLLTCGCPTARTSVWLVNDAGTSLPHTVTACCRAMVEVNEYSRWSNWLELKETWCLNLSTRRSFQTVSLTWLVACFMTALSMLSQWHFCHRRTVVNWWNKTFEFHKVV